MSEEIKPQEGEQAPEAPQYTETERLAMEEGWMPLEKWTESGRDAAEHRSAREFRDRGELLRRIQDQNKHIQRVTDSFETLRAHNANMYKMAYAKAIEDLRAQHRVAVNEGDIEKADKIVDQITEQKDQFTRAAIAVNQSATPAESLELTAWKEQNKWYVEDEDLATTADALGFKYVQKMGGKVSPQQVLDHVAKKMREKFPELTQGKHAQNQTQQKIAAPNPVSGERAPARAAPAGKGLKKSDLSEDEAKAMKDFVRYGLGDEAAYLKQLEQIR